MNVVSAWQLGYTGRGVVVTILDDGIEHNHTDLQLNYVSSLFAFNDGKTKVTNKLCIELRFGASQMSHYVQNC